MIKLPPQQELELTCAQQPESFLDEWFDEDVVIELEDSPEVQSKKRHLEEKKEAPLAKKSKLGGTPQEEFFICEKIIRQLLPRAKKQQSQPRQLVEFFSSGGVNSQLGDYQPRFDIIENQLILDCSAFENSRAIRREIPNTKFWPSDMVHFLTLNNQCQKILKKQKKCAFESFETRSRVLFGGSCDICTKSFETLGPMKSFYCYILRFAAVTEICLDALLFAELPKTLKNIPLRRHSGSVHFLVCGTCFRKNFQVCKECKSPLSSDFRVCHV